MAGLWGWITSEWRRSWRGLTLLAVLIAFAGAIAIAAIAGARRADSAFDDFLEQTSAPLAVTVTGQSDDLGVLDGAASLAPRIAAIPGVEGVTPTGWMGVAGEANGHVMDPFATAL